MSSKGRGVLRGRGALLAAVALPVAIVAASSVWLGEGGRRRAPATDQIPFVVADRLEAFASDDALAMHVRRLSWLRRADDLDYLGRRQQPGQAAPDGPPTTVAESITNNQAEAIEEGDIVKVADDYLLILRRGRLFSVRLDGPGLAAVSRVDVAPPGMGDGWIDELLVLGSTAIVLGYNRGARATQVGLFDVSVSGGLAHRSTHLIRSGDYYSRSNYTGRIVDGKLLLYAPTSFFEIAEDFTTYEVSPPHRLVDGGWVEDPSPRPPPPPPPPPPRIRIRLPEIGEWRDGEASFAPLLSAEDVLRPIQLDTHPILHTLISCDVTTTLSCRGRGVVGPAARVLYVATDASYLWVPDAIRDPRQGAPESTAVLYRLPHARGEGPGALRMRGSPANQLWVSRVGDSLHAMVGREGPEPDRGDAGAGLVGILMSSDVPWRNPDYHRVTIPVSAFALAAPVLEDAAYLDLPDPHHARARFVGRHLLFGDRASDDARLLYVHDLEGARTEEVTLSHGVQRIEALGERALVVGRRGEALAFSVVAVDGAPSLVSQFQLDQAAEADSRSHGFFFSPRQRSGGIFGLPFRRYQAGGRPRDAVGASVTFAALGEMGLVPLGSLSSARGTGADACVMSCFDWYGNARPIFLRGRIFALTGYELIEGRVDGARILEVDRLDFFANTRP